MEESPSGAQEQTYPPCSPQPLSSLPSHVRTSSSGPVTRSTSRSVLWLPEFGPGTVATLPPLLSYSYVMSCDKEELWDIIQFLYAQHKALHDLCTVQRAQLDAANAYLAVTQRRIAKLKLIKQLTSKQTKRRKLKKIRTRCFTLPELRARFEAEAAAAELVAKEAAEDDARTHRINPPEVARC